MQKNLDFYKNRNPSKQPQNKVLAKNGPHNRNQQIFLTHLNRFPAQKLHGTEHPIHAKSVIFLEFLHISDPDFRSFSSGIAIPYTKPIQRTLWYHPSLYEFHTESIRNLL